MAPQWLDIVAWVTLAGGFACAGAIAFDIFVRGRRQQMGVMEAVFPISALYFGPLALMFYWRWARAPSPPAPGSHAMHGDGDHAGAPRRPRWVTYAIETSHCGAGCTLGDVISLTCFEIGLFGWMALMTFVFFPAPNHLMQSSPSFWLLMQIGMIAGFATSWPANVWLLRRGIKVAM